MRLIDKIKTLLNSAKYRAKLNNIPFNLEPEDIIIPTHCPVLGIPLSFHMNKMEDDSVTLDRVYPELGYVKGNVLIVSFKANRIKSNASIEELESISKFYLKHIEEEWLKD